MPLFKKIIIEEVPPSTYELVMARLDQWLVAPIKEYTHSLNQESMAKFVEGNGLYVLSSLFLLCAVVLCMFGQQQPVALSEEEEMELKAPPELHRKVPASISLDDTERTELTSELISSGSASSSSSSNDVDNDDASSTASSVECPEDNEDDHSVEETYDNFLKVTSVDEMDGEVVGKVYETKVVFNDSDEDTALETPTSSPPSTPDRSSAIGATEDDAKSVSTTNTTSSSRRASLKKRLSSSFKRTSSNSSLSGMFKRNSSNSSLSGMVRKSSRRLSLGKKLDTTKENEN